jgi:hypothetical protein
MTKKVFWKSALKVSGLTQEYYKCCRQLEGKGGIK